MIQANSSQPNFQEMNRKELLSYFLDHRDDQEAFYALMDKLVQQGGSSATVAQSSRLQAGKMPALRKGTLTYAADY